MIPRHPASAAGVGQVEPVRLPPHWDREVGRRDRRHALGAVLRDLAVQADRQGGRILLHADDLLAMSGHVELLIDLSSLDDAKLTEP